MSLVREGTWKWQDVEATAGGPWEKYGVTRERNRPKEQAGSKSQKTPCALRHCFGSTPPCGFAGQAGCTSGL